jgi:hypothetical protein
MGKWPQKDLKFTKGRRVGIPTQDMGTMENSVSKASPLVINRPLQENGGGSRGGGEEKRHV